MLRRIMLMEHYDQIMGIANHDDVYSPEANPFTVCGAYETSDVFASGIRKRMYHEFGLYRIGERFKISVVEWLAQKPHQAMMQRDAAKVLFENEERQNADLLADERKLTAEMNNHRPKLD